MLCSIRPQLPRRGYDSLERKVSTLSSVFRVGARFWARRTQGSGDFGSPAPQSEDQTPNALNLKPLNPKPNPNPQGEHKRKPIAKHSQKPR